MSVSERFAGREWAPVEYDERGMTRWGWMVRHPERLDLIGRVDVGAFTYIQAEAGVTIGNDAEIGAHCAIYSVSSIDGKRGPVYIGPGAKIGAHSVIMPGVIVGACAIVGAMSFVNRDVPPGALVYGVPARRSAISALAGIARMGAASEAGASGEAAAPREAIAARGDSRERLPD